MNMSQTSNHISLGYRGRYSLIASCNYLTDTMCSLKTSPNKSRRFKSRLGLCFISLIFFDYLPAHVGLFFPSSYYPSIQVHDALFNRLLWLFVGHEVQTVEEPQQVAHE